MEARFRSWWQQIKTHPMMTAIIIVIGVLVIALIVVEVRLYGTGFAGKTLWDWLNLLGVLAIPIVVAVGGFWLNQIQKSREERHAAELEVDKEREFALEEYLSRMSELMLKEQLHMSNTDDEVRKVARVRTLTILPRLDANRKKYVLQFLLESGLIDKDKRIIDLSQADLSGANLRETDLRGAYLYGANLTGAEFSRANLVKSDLSRSNLYKASLIGANLRETDLMEALLRQANLMLAYLTAADLRYANLSNANLNNADLSKADLFAANLSGANLSGVNLNGADLHYANLSGANLNGANLSNAILFDTGFNNAILEGVNFSKAWVTKEQLDKAASLQGATMPDGSIHP